MHFATLLFGLLASQQSFRAVELHLSPTGDDSQSGTIQEPIQSLECARNRIRDARLENPNQTVRVVLHEGVYRLTETFTLTSDDSASAEFPTVYEAAEGERVVLSGACQLTELGFEPDDRMSRALPESARPHVRCYRIEGNNLSSSLADYSRSSSCPLLPSPLDIYSNERLLPVASYPNQGNWATDNHQSVMDRLRFESNDSWVHSFTLTNDEDRYDRVGTLDPSHIPQGVRYRIENVLSLLDEPGEWFVDESTSQLYWWPIQGGTEPFVSSTETLVSLYDVENTIIRGLCFEGARVQGVEIAGGRNCVIEHCTFTCLGNVGVHVFHGSEHTVASCVVHSTGSSGIQIEAGDASANVESGHRCLQNEVYDCCQMSRARRAGIAVFGCGVTVANNTIRDLPDWGISLCGTKHAVRQNEIQSVCLETSDTGAIYVSNAMGNGGCQIEANHIHHIGGFDALNCFGIYLDDQVTGESVVENVIHDAPRGIVVRGGTDNMISRNALYHCIVGVQFERQETPQNNRLVSNALACKHPVVTDDGVQSLTALHNLRTLESVFVDGYNGDFRLVDQRVNVDLGFVPLTLPSGEAKPGVLVRLRTE
jgi:hypothetical protein